MKQTLARHDKSGEIFALEIHNSGEIVSCLGPYHYEDLNSSKSLAALPWLDGEIDADWANAEDSKGNWVYSLTA